MQWSYHQELERNEPHMTNELISKESEFMSEEFLNSNEWKDACMRGFDAQKHALAVYTDNVTKIAVEREKAKEQGAMR
jgi:hypothetical protein